MNLRSRLLTTFSLLLITWPLAGIAQSTAEPNGRPEPRKVAAEEQREIGSMVRKRFAPEFKGEIEVRAAGPFRFAGTSDFFLIERQDLGSVLFETKAYGVAAVALEPERITKEAIIPRVNKALDRAGLEVKDREFANFQDEFAGTVHDKKQMPADFDPRRASKLVARTVAFQRIVDGVPVFGSELLVGLNSDGTIGRLRMHWPKLDPQLLAAGRKLQYEVREKKWPVPKDLQDKDTEVLEVAGGVGHSAFADPQFKSAAVVRVLYRKRGGDNPYPVSTVAYKYFDEAGKEVKFSGFGRIPGTPEEKKLPDRRAANQ